jgi:hypothetical protein
VPIPLAALHQAGAVIVLTAAVALRYTARRAPATEPNPVAHPTAATR